MSLKEFLAFDSLLADRTRLAIMAVLAAADEPIDFNGLLEHLELSKGNLSSHMRKLEDAKLVKIKKQFIDRKPNTAYSVTVKGAAEFRNYLDHIQTLISESAAKD